MKSEMKRVPETYAELVGLYIPRPLHDEVDYGNAMAVLDTVEEHGMSELDLGRLLGDRSFGTARTKNSGTGPMPFRWTVRRRRSRRVSVRRD